MEEMQIESGQLEISGSVFYLPQEPWIFTATIRQNILFGKEFAEKKFNKIVKACCLDQVGYIAL
jgi:ABC-type multidrug transport system fused ATPase/permease subunit